MKKIILFLITLSIISFSVSGAVIDADTYTRSNSATLDDTEVLGQSYTEVYSGAISNNRILGTYDSIIRGFWLDYSASSEFNSQAIFEGDVSYTVRIDLYNYNPFSTRFEFYIGDYLTGEDCLFRTNADLVYLNGVLEETIDFSGEFWREVDIYVSEIEGACYFYIGGNTYGPKYFMNGGVADNLKIISVMDNTGPPSPTEFIDNLAICNG